MQGFSDVASCFIVCGVLWNLHLVVFVTLFLFVIVLRRVGWDLCLGVVGVDLLVFCLGLLGYIVLF